MSALTLWRLFHRSGHRVGSHTSMLAIVAFFAATTIFLTVLGGVHGFMWRASDQHTLVGAFTAQTGSDAQYAPMYVMLALFACLLLLVPFAALSGAAARLAATRRDARLAALRLAGATNGLVARLTALEAAGQALAGALLGIVGYLAVMPVIMLLRFQGRHFTVQELWVGPWMLMATVAGVTLLALVAALSTLRRVSISPLGVAARVSPPMPGAWRALLVIGVFAAAVVLFMGMNGPLGRYVGVAVGSAIVFGVIALCFALVNLIGPWVISLRARAVLRNPHTAARMIAMRRVLDNPRRAWRNVSGIALAVFIAGITSASAAIGSVASVGGQDGQLLQDIGTGGLLTLVFAAVLAAVSSGIMQAGSVYDQAREYRMLMIEGVDARTLKRARVGEVFTPLNVVIVVAAVCSLLLMAPLVGQLLGQPSTLIAYGCGIVLCYALVGIGAWASNRAASRLSVVSRRADD